MATPDIRSFLQAIGERVPPASQLILVGGGALALLGSPRPTIDIDFLGSDVQPSELHRAIMQMADELGIHLEMTSFFLFKAALWRCRNLNACSRNYWRRRADLIFIPKSSTIFKS
ncbi:MAG: nucleotidyl transferase AbiEii/AbiGii toxin family protein [Anaerolineales bacterium]